MVNFTKSKFLSLPSTQQHRHLADLLRDYYADRSDEKSWNVYQELMGFLQLEPPRTALQDAYHFHLHQAGRTLKEHNLLPKVITDRTEPLSHPLPVDVFLDNLRSAHNVGSIIRSVEALGLGSIYAHGLTPKPSPKTAMGTEQWTSFRMASLKEVRTPLIAVELSKDAIPYYAFSYPEKFTIALGNEERGCSEEILKAAAHTIYIPMHGRKNSLNVANAFAIIAADIAHRHPLRKLAS